MERFFYHFLFALILAFCILAESVIPSDRKLFATAATLTEVQEQTSQAAIFIRDGNAYEEKKQYQESLKNYQNALAIYRKLSDRINEAELLQLIAKVYEKLGKFTDALYIYHQTLTIYRQIGTPSQQASALVDIGVMYDLTGQYTQALEFYQQALVIRQTIGDMQSEAGIVDNIGIIYYQQGKLSQALETYERALSLRKKVGDRVGEGNTLINLGVTYNDLGEYIKALALHQQSLSIFRQQNELSGVGAALNNLGLVHTNLGQYDLALTSYQEALTTWKGLDNRTEQSNVLLNIGQVYIRTQQYTKAIEISQSALKIFQYLKDRAGEATTLNNLGYTYSKLGQQKKAKETLQIALGLYQTLGDRKGEANTLDSLGTTYRDAKIFPIAFNYYQKAVITFRETGDRAGEALALSNQGELFKSWNQPELAILFYKQSINITEAIREELKGLSIADQKLYDKTIESRYRNLADLLLKQDRILEAQQVLDLLKVEELSEYLRNVRGNSDTAKGTDLQKPEQNIIALSNELAELQKLALEGKLAPQQQPRLTFLTNNEKEYNKQFNAFLEIPAVQKEIQELRRTQSAQNVDIQKYNRLRGNLSKLQNAALFYPLILEDRLELILIIANAPPIRKTVNLKRTDLNQAIASFLSNLRNPNSEVKPDAQKFYNWLIQPFEKELQQANIQTIVYAPDEGLRYIPLAALYNGKKWLVERYRINNITAASLTDFTPRPASSIRVLAAASSAKHDVKIGDRTLSFSPLPATKLEVDNIATKINTTKLVDRDFTESALTGKLNTHNIIHLATHGHFEVGQPEQSFILLGDGKISTISDIGSWTLTNVSLVVLSACETAIGGQGGKGKGIEIFGLGYQIHNAGASAAIATLWKVSDGGTERLMDAFYTAVKTGNVSNTEALRQAQVAMITGSSDGLGDARGIVSIEARPRTTSTVPAKISHPYYWGAFILIGNGM